ncbi:SRPBCC family protein [Actinoplanes sp. TRM 88003]|uniref:SRPBCC family protein n=1 Tax=Paractinoplanes aksuensis TaxID=2939490 RepID=A0ABT1DLW8_9ACTN|nr:SRPBCC family protein [Actinoplanes aksuensis]MCO8271839.1 SRPBCC family protein [Actinoplanes aksuensis]
MKITNEFTVHTPIERAWEALTDLPGIAPCLPGAQLTGVDGDVYQGKVKVKVGPVISDFAGTARFTEKDDEKYRAVIDAKGRDSRAGGNASALVTASLTPDGDSTLVSVDTDLKISGKLAQFGSGMIKEISNKLLAQFVANLEAKLATDQPAAAYLTAATAATAATASAPAAAPAAAASTAAAPASAASTAAAPSAAATDTVPATAAVVAPAGPAERPSADKPSPETLTANLIPAEPGAAEPATPAVAGSEPLAASTTTEPDGVTAPPATTTPPAPTTPAATTPAATTPTATTPAATTPAPTTTAVNGSLDSTASSVNGSPAPVAGSARAASPLAAADEEPEALDLLAVAGSSVYKRLIPAGVVVAVIIAVIVWLVGRR